MFGGGHCFVLLAVMLVFIHFPKNNLNLPVKSKPVRAGADATVNVAFCLHIHIWSSLDSIGFYAEIQIILGQCVISVNMFQGLGKKL